MCSPLPAVPRGPTPVTGSLNPVLHVRIDAQLRTSELHITVEGRRIVVFLVPSFTRFLVVLAKARRADRTGLSTWHGYRTVARISEVYADTLDSSGPLRSASVVSYVSRIGNLVTQAIVSLEGELDRDLEVPILIESRRLEGYRIGAHGLEVVGLLELEGC